MCAKLAPCDGISNYFLGQRIRNTDVINFHLRENAVVTRALVVTPVLKAIFKIK